jgi:hypothetical protein
MYVLPMVSIWRTWAISCNKKNCAPMDTNPNFLNDCCKLENKFNERFSKAINHLPGNKYVMEICLWKFNGKPHMRFLLKDFSCFPNA